MPAESKAQQRFMGMVHAVQKGEMKAPSKSVSEAASSISSSDAKDFASTKQKGLPEHKKEAFLGLGLSNKPSIASRALAISAPYVPDEELRDKGLSKILELELGSKGPFYRNQRFYEDLGGDELDLFNIIVELEHKRKLNLKDSDILQDSPEGYLKMKFPNLGGLEDYLAGKPKSMPIPNVLKNAAELGNPGLLSNAVSNTVGRPLNALNLMGPIVGGTASFQNPQIKGRLPKYQEIVEQFDEERPEELQGTKVRLGAPNLVDDLFWKQDSSGEEPWYDRVGGRVWHNPRTSLLGKTLGTVNTPIVEALTTLLRAPHYNPFTDAVNDPWNSSAVVEHELGHAIDWNKHQLPTGWKKYPERLAKRLGRDAYTLAYALPFGNLWHEAKANIESRKVLNDLLKKKKITPEQYRERITERGRRLPAGYGSYIGANVPIGAGLGPLVGAAVGRTAGPGIAREDLALYEAQHPEQFKEDGEKQDKDRGGKKMHEAKEENTQKSSSVNIDDIANTTGSMLGTAAGVGTGLVGLGALTGAVKAPSGHRLEGAGREAATRAFMLPPTLAGGGVGGLSGLALGSLLAHGLLPSSGNTGGIDNQALQQLLMAGGAGIGALGGGMLGAYGGHAAAEDAMGRPSWEKEKQGACNKTMKKYKVQTKKQATDLMAAYVRILANKAARDHKSAADNPLQRLAPAIQKHGDFFKALNEIYSNKSASYRAKIAKGLVKGLEKKIANFAVQPAPQVGAQGMEMQSPNGARASALMKRLTGGVKQMQQVPAQPQAAEAGVQ